MGYGRLEKDVDSGDYEGGAGWGVRGESWSGEGVGRLEKPYYFTCMVDYEAGRVSCFFNIFRKSTLQLNMIRSIFILFDLWHLSIYILFCLIYEFVYLFETY